MYIWLKHLFLYIFFYSEIFVSNVFQQTAEKEMDLICNQVISKVLEKLLPLATPEILRYSDSS